MRLKLWMRNMSVSAPRVTVRSSFPWPLRALLGFLAAALAAAAGIAIYEYGRDFAGPDRRELVGHNEQLAAQLRETAAERDRSTALANAYEGELKVERAAQEQLMQQVRVLEEETTRLKEDLAFYDSLLPAGKSDKGIVIRSFRLQPEDESQAQRMRFRLLIQQSGKADRDFVGSVQMEVRFTQKGGSFIYEMPETDATPERSKAFDLSFRHYQRLEGTFTLPTGAVANSVLVRVMAAGETQTQQSFNL
ncbi:MAG TPA: DUF6776 family protein [Burkholderiaceae bacterium]|jgi:hypothetical protein|nr:DUF6776 family protein [Burkholderiaceae bacterium]